MDWDQSFLHFTEHEYAEYYEWLENFGRWAGTVEYIIHTMNFKALTDSTQNFLFRYNLCSNKEPMA